MAATNKPAHSGVGTVAFTRPGNAGVQELAPHRGSHRNPPRIFRFMWVVNETERTQTNDADSPQCRVPGKPMSGTSTQIRTGGRNDRRSRI